MVQNPATQQICCLLMEEHCLFLMWETVTMLRTRLNARLWGCKNTMGLTSHPRWLGLLQALAGVAAVQVATLAEKQPEHDLEPVRLALATCSAEP